MSNTEQDLREAIKEFKPGLTDQEYERCAKALALHEGLEELRESGFTIEEREGAWRIKWSAYLKDLYESTGSWQAVFSDFIPEECYVCEIFVSLVEEETGKKITSAKDLQEATGIKAYGSFSEGKDEVIPYKTKPTEKQVRADTEEQVKDIFLRGMENKYYDTLYRLLKSGGKYSDLLKIEPSEFHLSETYKEETIKKVLCIYYNLWDPPGARPDVKTIAEHIEAPYSVVLGALT